MKVGDLVRVNPEWGGQDSIGIIVKVGDGSYLEHTNKNQVITLQSGWEYWAHELEVISESR